MRHAARVYVRPTRARLRVGLAGGVEELERGTGHGNVWSQVLAELRRTDGLKLVSGGRADVWLGDGHQPPPEFRPLVVQVHEAGWVDPVLRAFLDTEFSRGIETATGAALAAAADVITPSQASRTQVIEAFDYSPGHVHAVHHGVDHDLFRPGIPGGRELVGSPYVLFVGVLHPRKNLVALRQAVSEIAKSGLPQVLAVVGNPAADTRAAEFERDAGAELPGEPGRIVTFRGLPATALAALMAGADAFCLPSYYEGFGLPALEAMACGAPVIVSDRGALPEVVGDAGLVVGPEPSSVSDALRRVLSEPRLAERMRASSRARASGFNWHRTAAGWAEVLRSAA